MRYTIGQLARAASLGVETIRFYERRGLLPKPPRTASGYRQYPEDSTQRLRFIRRAKALGFSLDEIATLLDLQNGGSRRRVKAVASEKLAEIETRLTQLDSMRATLEELVGRCSGEGNVDGCPIIEALQEDQAGHG